MIPYDTPIDPDVQVAQILYIQRCRKKLEAEHKAERKSSAEQGLTEQCVKSDKHSL